MTFQFPPIEPFVRGLPDHAIYTSIISNSRYLHNWIANHYISITCNKNILERKTPGFDFFVDYYKCPYLDISKMPGEFALFYSDNIWDKLCEILDNGYIIQLALEESRMTNRQGSNLPYENIHNNCLYGYDRTCAYLGFFNKNGIYEYEKCPKEIFLKSLRVNKSCPLILAKPVINSTYKIEIEYIIQSLYDFLNSVNIASKYDYPIKEEASRYKAFGLEVYDYLRYYYEMLMTTNLKIDKRPLFLLKERKKCMILRLNILGDVENNRVNMYLEEYKNLEKKLKIACNLVVKYEITRKEKCLENVCDIMKIIYNTEKDIVSEICLYLKEILIYNKNNFENMNKK